MNEHVHQGHPTHEKKIKEEVGQKLVEERGIV